MAEATLCPALAIVKRCRHFRKVPDLTDRPGVLSAVLRDLKYSSSKALSFGAVEL